jgi:hypothetical protein
MLSWVILGVLMSKMSFLPFNKVVTMYISFRRDKACLKTNSITLVMIKIANNVLEELS